MKAMSKSNAARLQRGARSNAAVSVGTKPRKAWTDPFEDQMGGGGWNALDTEIDLEDFDLDSLEDSESASSDWLADRDLAMEIAQRGLH